MANLRNEDMDETTDGERPRLPRSIALLGGAAAVVGAPVVGLLASATPASGVTTIAVDSLIDGVANASDCAPSTGNCSLRDALAAATTGDTIVFASGLTGTFTLTQGQLEVSAGVTITGPGSSSLVIDANGLSRVFDLVVSAGDVSISGLTISGAITGDYGGGIRAENAGALNLLDVSVTGNTSVGGGGGVFARNAGPVSIYASTIDGNSSSNGWGGGLYLGTTGQSVSIADSTVSDNSCDPAVIGGGLGLFGSGNTIVVANSTITGNDCGDGAGVGIYNGNAVSFLMSTISGNTGTRLVSGADYAGGIAIQMNYTTLEPAASVTITGTILSGNSSPASPDEADLGNHQISPVTISDSLIGAATTNGVVDGGGNVASTTPLLGPLGANGGTTRTMALLAGSPALDAGPTTVPSFTGNQFDQRGAGFPRVRNGRSDIGAYELQAVPPPTTTTTLAPTTTVATDPVVPAFTG